MKPRSHSVIVRLTLSYIAVAMLTSLLVVVVSYGLGSVEWQFSERNAGEIASNSTVFADPFGVIEFDLLGITVLPFTLVFAAAVGILSIPAALLLVWLTGYPLVKRLRRIATVSRQFAEGNYQVRVVGGIPDEVGQVAQQFNDMADALQQHIHLLRSLAQENAMLAQTVETAAAQAERIRLSQDLHDALAQQLFSLTYGLSSLATVIRQNPEEGALRANMLAEIAEKALLDLRGMLLHLRPQVQAEKGLAATVRDITQHWQTLYHIPVEVTIVLNEAEFRAVVREALCLILQEALTNVAKHAHATQVTVDIQNENQSILLRVQDNGVGIPASKVPSGFGLTHMRERAEAVGGTFSVQSSASTGTCVQVHLP
jgi:NarL family two-component system sensor histidine kinase LiaS